MKKMILLCSFGLFGTFALASNEIVIDGKIVVTNHDSKTNTGEPETDPDCGCETSPDGTCTITYYCDGLDNPPTGQDVYNNVSYATCKRLAQQAASAGTCE